MTDILAASTDLSSSGPSQTIQQKPIKSLTTSVDDDAKFESDHEQQSSEQVQASKSKLSESYPADDAKEVEVESQKDYALAPETEQEEASYSLSTKQDDVIDYVADVYPEFYSQEMEIALDNVRKLASWHQESLVNNICDTFASYNGREASINDLAAIFNRLKSTFATEATEDLEEEDSFSSDDEDDSDYDPNDVGDRVQVSLDLAEDYYVERGEYDDDSDPDDADYDANNFVDLHQQALDQQEDIFDSEEPLLLDDTFATELDEDEVVESDTFDAEYFEAIKYAQLAGKSDAAMIIESIQEEFEEEYGEELLADIIAETFSGIAESQLDDVEESESSDKEEEDAGDEESKASELVEEEEGAGYEVDSEDFQAEMSLALENVRELASYHQEELIATISDLYALYNGSEPSVTDLSNMFAGIKQEFADEAAEEILEDVDEVIASADQDEEGSESDEEKDSDYNPEDPADVKQVEEDLEEDYTEDDDEESADTGAAV